MNNKFALYISLILVSGCAGTPKPIPDNYSGALSKIYDTKESVSSTRVYFYQLNKIDGRTIKTSSWETMKYNHGRGFSMTPKVNSRKVPSGKSVLTIEGVTHVAAPILSFTGGMYSVKGDVTVELEENKNYYVKGKLSKEYSSVWLEDEEGNIVSNKIEKLKE